MREPAESSGGLLALHEAFGSACYKVLAKLHVKNGELFEDRLDRSSRRLMEQA